MSDISLLPGNWTRSMRGAASASEAVRNIIRSFDPTWHVLYDNFLGDVLPDRWAAAKTNGTSAAVTNASSQLTCTTGTDNDGYAGQGYGLHWKGDNGLYFESQQAADVITTLKVEVGITDVASDAGAVNVKATPSATATDFCVVIFDTDDNTQVDVISQDTSGVAAAAEDVHTLVAATNFTVRMVHQNDLVNVSVGSSVGNLATVASAACQGGSLVTPWWFAQARAISASRILTVEYVVMVGPNGVAP